MGSSRQEYWSGLSFLSPGDLPDPGFKPGSSALAGEFFFLPLSHLGSPKIRLYPWKTAAVECGVEVRYVVIA